MANHLLNTSATVTSPSRVRFEPNAIDQDEEEQARLRRGTVSPELKNQIALRSMLGRKAVEHGYSTGRSFSRSQSEASIFRPLVRPPTTSTEDLGNPSNTLWESGYTQLSRVKSTSSVIGGLNDDPLRAGWRRNEPGPLWEQSHELEPDRTVMACIDEGDGFDPDEIELDGSNPGSLMGGDDHVEDDDTSPEDLDKLGTLPTPDTNRDFIFKPRGFSKTQSMPVGGTFGTRPEQPGFHRPYDETFMRMDVPF
ncbi:uncharacterized protein MELLADRAFT_73217 [Melampsora larici-populina 98AG31]|uniref:Uncharacterized protein n=1 Tax=Melampsora larici-populina (strain 98AG31 / pathotype 3-4-7) TaxID=747676 RepID=F4S4Z3_MELLP|nr:uncharacterized protein MELLADRAFT_73217 [Melampsora larici-populina 98AG31]EGG00229.1 hypothetical protein MELLADRAFT_73217 [Melampsora larici-populina 98AG31]